MRRHRQRRLRGNHQRRQRKPLLRWHRHQNHQRPQNQEAQCLLQTAQHLRLYRPLRRQAQQREIALLRPQLDRLGWNF